MRCRLCFCDRKTVASHIVPKAFWVELRGDDGPPVLISGAEGVFPQKSQIGVYDETILCEDCEAKFNDVDDYAIRVLLKEFDSLFAPVWDTTFPARIVAYESGAVDQERLLRFLVSVLWRASVSTQPTYKRVNLGSLEVLAATAIDRAVPLPEVFGAMLARWTPAHAMGYDRHPILDPVVKTMQGMPVYMLYFGQFVAYLRTTGATFPSPLDVISVGVGETLNVTVRNFEGSSELQAMLHTVELSRVREEHAAEARRLRKRGAAGKDDDAE